MTKILTLDCETTGATNDTKGNPFSESNRLCFVGCLFGNNYYTFDIEYSNEPYGKRLAELHDLVRESDLLVLFNAKFDLHWLRRYGITSFQDKKIWDCQAVEFILSKQTKPYPSLDEALLQRGLGGKLSTVRTEYWENGIDTDKVPTEVLLPYLEGDVKGTFQLYQKQLDEVGLLPVSTKRLISLVNLDTLVLEEMEWNGLSYDIQESLKRTETIEEKIGKIDEDLNQMVGLSCCNWDSGDHVSAVLYGGTIKEKCRETYIHTYKDGSSREKQRWGEKIHILSPLTKPLKGTELKKEGKFKTDEGTLRKLSGNKYVKRIIKYLLERSKLEQLKSTYYVGFPKLHRTMQWEPDILHTNLNQCRAATGRLSSTSPNIQNSPTEVRELIKSRYA